jgi:hypothetical protein
MHDLLKKFISSFQKAISVEMNAMRQRMGPFEVPLAQGKPVESGDDSEKKFYAFTILKSNDNLVLQAECTLKDENGETLVTIMNTSFFGRKAN